MATTSRGLVTGPGRPSGSDVDNDPDLRASAPPAQALAWIWAYAIASGLVAFGITQIIAVLDVPRGWRDPLQLSAIPAVAVVAGLACNSALTRVRSAIACRLTARSVRLRK
jgi:hypothetical protein